MRPPRIPRYWIGISSALLLLGGLTIAVTWYLGQRLHGNPGEYFGEKKLGTFASVAALAGAAVVCHLTEKRLAGQPAERFWKWAAYLFGFLALDDGLRIHENIDFLIHRIIGRDRNDPLTTHLDDLIVASYGVVALALGWRYRKHLIQQRLMIQTLMAAFACFAAMVVLDFTSASKAMEDSLKLVGGILIVIAFLAAYLEAAEAQADLHLGEGIV
jgi:hypothetical protein